MTTPQRHYLRGQSKPPAWIARRQSFARVKRWIVWDRKSARRLPLGPAILTDVKDVLERMA